MKLSTITMISTVCASTALAGFATACIAPDASMPAVASYSEQDVVTGTIVKADLDSNTFVLRTSEDKSIEFTVSTTTKYWVDGKEATKEQTLKSGANATVHHEDNKASRISVRTE